MVTNIQPSPILNQNPSFVWRMLNAFFPPFCCNCGELGYELCPKCIELINPLDQNNICPICGDITPKGFICSDCENEKPHYDQLRSLGLYSGVLREVIQKIKFNHGVGLIDYFVNPCVEFIKSWNIKIDQITPVPLSLSRHHNRGFNQAALFAKPISKNLHIPYNPQALERVKDTLSQVGLNAKAREENVLNAFEAKPENNLNKSVLVIDDITTTGSTLNECAKALKAAGARFVFCFTVARTPIMMNQFKGLEVE